MATIDERDSVPIPQPPGYPLIGNVSDIDPEQPTSSLMNLSREYGEIYSLTLFGQKRLFINSVALLTEVCDEKRFTKAVGTALKELRAGIHDGLFTAHHGEKNWELAHRILVPAFGPLHLHDMFDDMKDIASQLVLKWARYGPSYCIPAADDFTRLTLDTLALCAMSYRFNSFYTEEMHPFIDAMTKFLKVGGSKTRRPKYMSAFYRAEDSEFEANIAYMRNLSADLVKQRRENPTDSKDLLNAMVNGKDPKTGESLSQDTIIDNMITFLIAGHETTSGLLSFLWYYMLKSPEAYRKAQEEVDSVIGTESIKFEHLSKLPYINAMLRETLRLQPTAPGFSTTPKQDTEVIGGKYRVVKGEPILAVLHSVHRDPAVYGEDAEEWKPERMLDENFNKLPPAAWKPFGNGVRACIGRPFAWQEALMVVATLLQYLNFHMDDSSYDLQVKSTLTIKPKDFNIRATLRDGWTATKIEQNLSGAIKGGPRTEDRASKAAEAASDKGIPFTILYGSNSGTCEAFAQTLAADAASHGFKASKIDTLDSITRQKEPPTEPVAIITASYEGQPTDNAGHFYDWLTNLPADHKLNTSHAVFGAGHSDWKATFHRIPTSIDDLLTQHESTRICARGSADAAKGDMMSEFQSWEDQIFWPAMQKAYGGESSNTASEAASGTQNLTVEISSRRASHLRADVSEAKVISAHSLTAPGVPERRHIEIQLPTSMTYRAGDYLAVLPLNPTETVHRVFKRFTLPWDAMLTLSSKTGTALPTDSPISAHALFSAYLELSQPATKRNLAMLVASATDPPTRKSLESLSAEENFPTEITSKRTTLLDLLERFPTLPLPLSAFVASLITMRVRQYSISSSPLPAPNVATLTYAVLDTPSLSGQGRHIGVASHYLSRLQAGDVVHVAVKPSNQAFHLPAESERVPVVMVAAGTGVAPFRAFVMERAAQIGAGRKLAEAHLYVGCRDPAKDELYREQFDRWESLGAVTVHRAYSKAPEKSNGFAHVDDVLRSDRELLRRLWKADARVYVCGSRGIGDAARGIAVEVRREACRERGEDDGVDEAEKWFESVRNERYSTDVFD